MVKTTKIPTILFYGESEQSVTPDLLHCESLITRSQIHKFEIKPHRHHDLNQIFYLKQGSGEANIDGVLTTVTAPCLIVIPAMCVHDFLWSKNVEGTVISIASPLLEVIEKEFKKEQLIIDSITLIAVDKGRVELEGLLDVLVSEYQYSSFDLREQALKSLINLLAIWLERHAPIRLNTVTQQSKSAQYFNQFTQLINRDFITHRKCDSYAKELGITVPYLNNVCHQLVGKNAQQLCHERLLLEAKRSLIYTVLSISEIAYELGFNDPAYFTRFFKRQTGLSPKAFRNNLSLKSS